MNIEITATGGIGGDDAGATSAGDDGVDETGGGPTVVTDHCLFEPDPAFFGLKFQCRGFLSIQIEVNDMDPEFLTVDFGNSLAADSYEEPFVMACCPEFDGEVNTNGNWSGLPSSCPQPHYQACTVDMIETGCKSLVPRLTELAQEHSGVVKEAILKTADFIAEADTQIDCLTTFLVDTGVATTLPTCGSGDTFVPDYPNLIEGMTWSFDPTNTTLVDQVDITVNATNVVGLNAPGDPPVPVQCGSADDNDHLSFLQIDPTAGDVKVAMTGGSVVLVGPVVGQEKVSGYSSFASSSSQCTLPYCSHGAWTLGAVQGDVFSLSFYSDGQAEVGTSTEELVVDSFQFHLFTPARGDIVGNALSIAPGEALFVMSGSAAGESRWIPAWNATAIEIRPVRDYWSISAFTIDYEDGNEDLWSLELAPSTWR